ncbi:MAG: pantetheine-phosphate adenylyltransferase [Candidatus Omnitrophica bacterium]|nr:pantetheine-phosphate adenylyltransferase [Candidatus Omnitrophota bacterium]
MKKVLYPGTFDPITLGHLDLIKRASSIFEEVIVAIAKNSPKNTFFSYQERLDIVSKVIKPFKNVKLEGFEGLIVEFARKKRIRVLLRGLRMISDFEYEFQMALTNRKLASKIETMFLMPDPRYSYVSAKLIKEAAFLGADLKEFLPSYSLKLLRKKVYESSHR